MKYPGHPGFRHRIIIQFLQYGWISSSSPLPGSRLISPFCPDSGMDFPGQAKNGKGRNCNLHPRGKLRTGLRSDGNLSDEDSGDDTSNSLGKHLLPICCLLHNKSFKRYPVDLLPHTVSSDAVSL